MLAKSCFEEKPLSLFLVTATTWKLQKKNYFDTD